MSVTTVDRRKLGLIKKVAISEAGELGVHVDSVILFGSRSRGDAREDSDWDILVVVREELNRDMMRELTYRIRAKLVEFLQSPVDVIVSTKGKWEKYKDEIGHLFYSVKREGITA